MSGAPLRSLTRDEVRQIDQRAIDELGMPGLVLMENAGRGAAERILIHHPKSVVVCAGHGNNGGDGFVIARHLDNASVPVLVLLFADPERLTGDALTNWQILIASSVPTRVFGTSIDVSNLDDQLKSADWIVDALLGTGTRGEIREPYRTVIERINASRKPVLAIDLPSGLDCDTGRPLGPCIRAQETVTFVARKAGFDSAGSEEWTGPVHVAGIGVPHRWLETITGR